MGWSEIPRVVPPLRRRGWCAAVPPSHFARKDGIPMNARLASFSMLAWFLMIGAIAAQEVPQPQPQPRARRAAAAEAPGPAGPLVTLEVLLIDHNVAVDGKEGASAPSAADFVKLYKQGKLERVVRAQLASVAGNPTRVQIGERVPVVTA